MEQALKQAARYGEQVRLLEDAGRRDDQLAVRRAYMVFVRQFKSSGYSHKVREAYYNEYEK